MGNLWVIVVRVCEPEFRNLPHSYTRPLKNGPKFFTHLLLVVDRYYSQFIEYQENKQSQKSLSEKIYAYTGISEKWGLSHTNQEKSGQSYTFC